MPDETNEESVARYYDTAIFEAELVRLTRDCPVERAITLRWLERLGPARGVAPGGDPNTPQRGRARHHAALAGAAGAGERRDRGDRRGRRDLFGIPGAEGLPAALGGCIGTPVGRRRGTLARRRSGRIHRRDQPGVRDVSR